MLTMLMNVHPSISTIGELKATSMEPIEDYMCSCGEQIHACHFWKDVQSDLEKKYSLDLNLGQFGTHFNAKEYIKGKILSAQLRGKLFEATRREFILRWTNLTSAYKRILDKNVKLVETICDLQGGEVFLDGSKDPNRLRFMHDSDQWDIYVIKLVRDGRAQSNSARNKSEENTDYIGAVGEWKKTIKQMNRVCDYFPQSKVLSIKYEDLCANPNDVMNGIWNYVGLNDIEQDWSNVVIDSRNQHIIGNNMRKKESIKIRLDTKWIDSVSKQELDYFDSKAGQLNRDLGYQSTI